MNLVGIVTSSPLLFLFERAQPVCEFVRSRVLCIDVPATLVVLRDIARLSTLSRSDLRVYLWRDMLEHPDKVFFKSFLASTPFWDFLRWFSLTPSVMKSSFYVSRLLFLLSLLRVDSCSGLGCKRGHFKFCYSLAGYSCHPPVSGDRRQLRVFCLSWLARFCSDADERR